VAVYITSAISTDREELSCYSKRALIRAGHARHDSSLAQSGGHGYPMKNDGGCKARYPGYSGFSLGRSKTSPTLPVTISLKVATQQKIAMFNPYSGRRSANSPPYLLAILLFVRFQALELHDGLYRRKEDTGGRRIKASEPSC